MLPPDFWQDKKALFWDAGFTLVEPNPPVAQAYWNVACAVGVALPWEDFQARMQTAWAELRVKPRRQTEALASSDELEAAAWRHFTTALAQYFPDLLPHYDRWHAGLVEHFDTPQAWRLLPHALSMLDQFRQCGIRLAVISNWHSRLPAILAGLLPIDWFEMVITSVAVGYRKPHPAIFGAALEQMQLPATVCCHIGDSWEEDVCGAQAVGMSPIYFQPTKSSLSLASSIASAMTTEHATVPTIACLSELLPTS